MTITDEMLKTAWLANHGFPVRRKELKTVLEAVAPLLIAQGMYMAADMLTGDPHSFRERILGRAAAIATGSAQELDPK